MLPEQVLCCNTQTSRIIVEVTEAEVARLADQPTEPFAAVVMIDVESATMTTTAPADGAPLHNAQRKEDGLHLALQTEPSYRCALSLELELLRMGAFPTTLLGIPQVLRGALVILPSGGSRALKADGPRLGRRSRADAKRLDAPSTPASRAALRLADRKPARTALGRHYALGSAAVWALVVGVVHHRHGSVCPMCARGLSPKCAGGAS